MKILFALYAFVFVLPICFCQDTDLQHLYLCDTTLQVQAPVNNIAVMDNGVKLTTTLAFSIGEMTLRNNTDLPITEYAFLLEVFDKSQKRLYGIVFHNVYRESSDPVYPPYKDVSTSFHLSPVYALPAPIEPGASFELTGISPILSSRCPDAAAMRFVFLKFANGKTVTQASPAWRTDPAVAIATDHLDLENCAIPKGKDAIATLTFDAKGKVESLRFGDPEIPVSVGRCLSRELSRWEFEPAIIDGKPQSSQLRLMFLFDPSNEDWGRWHNKHAKEMEDGVALFTLNPWDSKRKEWSFTYSGSYSAALGR